MKKAVVFLASIACLIGCTVSPQKQAEKLAADFIKQQLYIPDSYEAVSTLVDTAYYNPFFDVDVLKHAKKIVELEGDVRSIEWDIERAEREMKSAKSSMSIWGDSYSAFSRNQYAEAKSDYQKAEKKYNIAVDNLKEKKYAIADERLLIEEAFKNEQIGSVIGWAIQHKYRAKTQGGLVSMGNEYIIASQDFSSVIFAVDEEDAEFNSCAEKIAEIAGIQL